MVQSEQELYEVTPPTSVRSERFVQEQFAEGNIWT